MPDATCHMFPLPPPNVPRPQESWSHLRESRHRLNDFVVAIDTPHQTFISWLQGLKCPGLQDSRGRSASPSIFTVISVMFDNVSFFEPSCTTSPASFGRTCFVGNGQRGMMDPSPSRYLESLYQPPFVGCGSVIGTWHHLVLSI